MHITHQPLKVGDTVYVDVPNTPKLSFVIQEIRTEGGQKMVCGEYGCFAINLLIKQVKS